ncbi:MAG: OmpA family protein [Bacteroidales bacterium]|nr:OmpA family protein [Bacteroidales bacterium]
MLHKIKYLLISLFFSFSFFSIAQTDNTAATFHVLVIDNSDIPQKGEIVIFKNIKTLKEFAGTTDSTGKFDIVLTQGEEYEVIISTFGKEETPKTIKIPVVNGKLDINYKITTSVLNKFLLDIQFEFGKPTLDSHSYTTLDDFYNMLDTKRNLKVEIGGHTDNVGDDASNQKLSEGRANTVRDYLIGKGIAANRIIAKGYGETQPVADNATDEGRQKNRRTEVIVIQD